MENFTAVLNGQRYVSRAGRLKVSPEPVEISIQEARSDNVQDNVQQEDFHFLLPEGARVIHYSSPVQVQPDQSDLVEQTEKKVVKSVEDADKWLIDFISDFNKSLMYS